MIKKALLKVLAFGDWLATFDLRFLRKLQVASLNLMATAIFISHTLLCSMSLEGAEQTAEEAAKESVFLRNIQQLTTPSLGFEKAGEAYFSQDNKTIIFQAVPTGQKRYQIYTMDIEERIPKLVSTGSGACTCAFFRPDGKKIIFASSHEAPEDDEIKVPGYQRQGGNYAWAFTPYMNIYEANPDGTELKALTSGLAYHAECAYSCDGKKIVYASNEDGTMNIYTMDADGTNTGQITKSAVGYSGGCFFSPDNQKIVFRADYDRKDYLQIYTINADGTDLRQLTCDEAVNWAPYWHPSGEFIAYATSLHGHYRYEIYLLNINTGIRYRLTYNPSFDGLPVFSNDGKKLLWTSKRGADNTSQVFIADFIMP